MQTIARRKLLLAAAVALASPAAAAAARPRNPAPTTVTLLGQSLIQHDLCAANWPSRAALQRLFHGADAVFTDLETAIRGGAAEAPTRTGEFLHAAEPGVIDCLTSLGVNLFATSNNHAFDLGTGGVKEILAQLDARGLSHAGSGADLAAASAPASLATAQGPVSLVGFATGAIREGAAATPMRAGVNEVRRDAAGRLVEEDVSRVLASLSAARRRGGVVLAYHHNHFWEPEMAQTPAWQRELAGRCVDAGASAFASHGAPLLQGVGLYRGAPLFFGLGSFIFQTVTAPGKYPPTVWDGAIAQCRFAHGTFLDATLTPLSLEAQPSGDAAQTLRGRPDVADGPNALRIAASIKAASPDLRTAVVKAGRLVFSA